MTNLEYIRQLSIQDVAELLITVRTFEDFDYNWDEELEYRGLASVYVCSDGEEFDVYDEALNYEIWWLQQEKRFLIQSSIEVCQCENKYY